MSIFIRLIFTAWFCLSGAIIMASAQSGGLSAEDLFQAGERAYRLRDYDAAAAKYLPAAQLGHAKAQTKMGRFYFGGFGVTKSYSESEKWMLKAGGQGNIEAQNYLGNQYGEYGKYPRSFEKSAIWYEKAARQGDRTAQYELGDMYFEGQGVEQSYDRAAYWFEKSKAQGNPASKIMLEKIARKSPQSFGSSRNDAYYDSLPTYNAAKATYEAGDYDQAFKMASQISASGNVHGHQLLGLLYENGHGVAQDYDKALKLYRASYNNGQNVFAQMEYDRLSAEVNKINAEKSRRAALTQDERDYEDRVKQRQAADELAAGPIQNGWDAYNAGDYPKAFKILKVYADGGNARAQARIGVMYKDGKGVKQDFQTAGWWFEQAEKGDSGEAFYHHALLRYRGQYSGRTHLQPDQLMGFAYRLGYQPAIDRHNKKKAEEEEKARRQAELSKPYVETDLERRRRLKREFDRQIDEIGKKCSQRTVLVNGQLRVTCD